MLLLELPDYVKAGIDYLKIRGREHPKRLVGDITRFYRTVLDDVLACPDEATPGRDLPELEELKRRWDTERERRNRRRVLNSQIGRRPYLIERV